MRTLDFSSRFNLEFSLARGSLVSELERTPGMVAVSRNGQEAGVNSLASPFCPSARQILGGVGGQSPPGGGGDGGYLEAIANVVQVVPTVGTKTSIGKPVNCPGFFVVGQCKNGHRFAKELYCGREWCPVCGEDDSPAHIRRFARWVTKAQQLETMGYLIFTLPEEVRSRYRKKARLNELTKRVTAGDKSRHIEGLLKGMGFDRGLARWHWFGETSGKWHPHLNVVIEAGYLTEGQLLGIKRAYAGILGVTQVDKNGDPLVDIYYKYKNVVPKMIHTLKYITRATFKDYTWDGRMAAELYNFRNMRSWGKWVDEPAWQLEGKAKLEQVAMLEKGLCPDCGEPVIWSRARDIAWLKLWVADGQFEPLEAGYWQAVLTKEGKTCRRN